MENMFGWNKNTPPRRMMETTGAYDGGLNIMTTGLTSGTRVATSMGWRQVNAIAVGDLVLTFDHGMQKVTEVSRSMAWVDAPWTAERMWPVHIPAGALGNYAEMTVLADQGLMIESEAALDQHGDPYAVVPALSLVGVRGITRRAPRDQIEVITLTFEAEQVIYAEGNLLAHCPASCVSLDTMLNRDQNAYEVLSVKDATFLAECFMMEDNTAAHAQAA
ncbi:Hint domain-containing protein [bacterium]|nr:Hint domain-containing protein [bacterium]